MEKIMEFVKNNKAVAIGAAALAVLLLFRGARRRSRRRRSYKAVSPVTRRKRTRRSYNKAIPGKKPWQVKGSEAARRHMARLRKMR